MTDAPLTLTLPGELLSYALITALCEAIVREDERGATTTARALRSIAQQLQAHEEARGAPVRAWLEEQYAADE